MASLVRQLLGVAVVTGAGGTGRAPYILISVQL
jgi:hypothetical protein